MEKQFYMDSIKNVIKSAKDEMHLINMSWVKENAKFKIGDIIYNVTGMIEVSVINYRVVKGSVPDIIYSGERKKRFKGKIVSLKHRAAGDFIERYSMLKKININSK